MRVIMIGTPTCVNCKKIAPKVEEYCQEHQIDYEYYHFSDAPSHIVEEVMKSGMTQAPIFLVYKETLHLASKDSIFTLLENS